MNRDREHPVGRGGQPDRGEGGHGDGEPNQNARNPSSHLHGIDWWLNLCQPRHRDTRDLFEKNHVQQRTATSVVREWDGSVRKRASPRAHVSDGSAADGPLQPGGRVSKTAEVADALPHLDAH
jgi:hypothetical protein